MFPSSVRVVIPQSYDFVETPGEGVRREIHVKNEEKPWTMFGTPEAREVEAILTRSGIVARADLAFCTASSASSSSTASRTSRHRSRRL